MEACNNGHFWMFHTDGVNSEERLDADGKAQESKFKRVYEALLLNTALSYILLYY